MPDTSHDTADDGFHEIHLSGKELVLLFIFTTFVSVAIFLCGVMVGRRAREVSGDAPVTVAAEAAPSPAQQPLADAAGPPAAEPPAPAADVPEELSYHKRLQSDATPTEELKKDEPKKDEPKKEVAKAPEPVPAAPAPRPAAAAPPPAAAPANDVATTGKPGVWAVQVYASRDRAVAGALVKRLSGKGYPAFLVMPPTDVAEQFYKVHVGRYRDRREAEQVSLRLKKEEQFQPWITR